MKWITAGDIKTWVHSKQRHCAETLPELVRRLIFATATATSIEEIEFPGGDSIAAGGWDGRLKTSMISPFFPSGVSGWEIGSEGSPGIKANKDYNKRTTQPLGLIPKDSTFVFVTPRPWPGRVKWELTKRKPRTRKWKDVRVIGADLLEQWLDSAPAVALWLAKEIGKVVSGGVRGLESMWEEWSLATNPAMTSELVIGGRTRDLEHVHKWLNGSPGVLSVQGDSPDEAPAFLYSAIEAMPELSRVRVLSRAVLVENISELRQLTQAYQFPLIIAAPGECIEGAGAAVAKGHHIFLSMDATLIDIGNVFRLSRPKPGIVEQQLKLNRVSQIKAQSLARDFGRSIPVLRRHIYRSSAVRAPKWANLKSATLLLPVLLAGAWTDGKEGDRSIIEQLSGLSYNSFTTDLQQFLTIDDAPIRKVGDVWTLKSPLDAWFLLARHLNSNYLKRFRQAVSALLTKTDPKYDLPIEERWAATIYGKSNPSSEWIRVGMVESMVLFAVYGDRSPSPRGSAQPFVDSLVKEVLTDAKSWEAWASMRDVTALLAEASPGVFIDVVTNGIEKNPTLFLELMKDDPGVFGECRHSGLLWALESVAWSPEFFNRAVSALSDLARIDSGGRWTNRPINSLEEIFRPQYPQTYASPLERLATFDQIMTKDPKITWQFAKGYFTQGYFSESHRFRWRDAGGDRRGFEPEKDPDGSEYVRDLLPRLSELACKAENLVGSLNEFMHLRAETREMLLRTIEDANPASLTQEQKEEISQAIRQVLNWINTHGNSGLRAHVGVFNAALKRFAPDDVIRRVGWLLSNPWPRLPEGEPPDYKGQDERVAKAQEQAAREVLDNAPMERILDFAGTLRNVYALGHAMGNVVKNSREDITVLDTMLTKANEIPLLIAAYALGRIEVTNPDWIPRQVERLKATGNYSAQACGLLYLALPEGAETWSVVAAQGKDTERGYWKHARGYSRTDQPRDAPIAVEKLLDVGRPFQALEIAGRPDISVPSELLKRLIQELLLLEGRESRVRADGMMGFHLGHVFTQLYQRGELSIGEIAQLEWPFAAAFETLQQFVSSPLAIHRFLQTEPSFFAELIAFMYKRDDNSLDPGQEGIEQETRKRLASNARAVLDSWRLLPGLNDDGSVTEKRLIEWVEAARERYAATLHMKGGDIQIGFMLAQFPGDTDGNWPRTAVCNLIERLNSDVIDEHVEMGIYNSRGVVSRGLADGGAQERALANKYYEMSESVRPKWPRTAAILRSIGNSYVRYAEHEDTLSELNDLRFG